jgi:hypothetical protein
MNFSQRVLNILIAVDQLGHVLINLGNANPTDTISADLWVSEAKGKWQGKLFRPLVDKLFWFDPRHCETSWDAQKFRKRTQ